MANPIQPFRPDAPPASIGAKHNELRQNQNVDPIQPSFADLLRIRQGIAPGTQQTPAAGDVRFSAHAQTRIQSRGIAMDKSHLDRLNGAVQRAADKGSRDALVLMDNVAMVVSVKNRTVVTVVDKDSLKQNVFTNIDSAVIA